MVGGFDVGTASVSATAFSGGVATTALPVYTFTNHATTRRTVPTTIILRAADADASSSGFAEGTTEVRGGRVRLFPATGSERLDLLVSMQAQYWNGTAWVTNSQDKCTGDPALGVANTASVSLAPATAPAISTCVQDTGFPGLSGSGCAAAGTAARRYLEGPAPPGSGFAGDFNLWLKAPGAAGTVIVTGNVPGWLQYDWGTGVLNPSSRATFGVNKGPNEFIYMRELY
jgi:MSHA biogenesis protein MshQ